MNDDIQKLWQYIKILEKRITDLEQKQNFQRKINPYNPDDYLERKYGR